jgi:hypothetical protein
MLGRGLKVGLRANEILVYRKFFLLVTKPYLKIYVAVSQLLFMNGVP